MALSLAAVSFSGVARAQDAKDSGEDAKEIVVTGTLLRNAAPVGSSVISVGQQQAQAQGATTSNELLATVPQVSNLFNSVPSAQLNIAVNNIQVIRPNLRNLSPDTSSSSSTLVLVDGHRIAGIGVTQSSIDPDIIPAGAIERVEVVTDGGSATYGADAVGGVINFITRKRFDGLKVDARYGFADQYWQVDANAIAGKDWGSGSLFVSYMFQKNRALFGRDRDWIRQVDWSTPSLTPVGKFCNPGNVSLPGGANYALPNLSTPGLNACDQSDDKSFVPQVERHSVMAGLHQELSGWLTVDLRAFYGQRDSLSYDTLRGAASVTSSSAYYRPIAAKPTATQTVFYTFAPVLGTDSAPSGTSFQEWGANAEFKANLDNNWQLRTLLNYSRSNTTYYITGVNSALVAAAGSASDPAQAVNFYDPASTSNLALIRAIGNNYSQAGQGKDELFDARAILDGSLLTLPGGDVRVALGYEFMRDNFQQRAAADIVPGTLSSVPYNHYGRSVNSAFGELQVPIFGDGNRTGGLYSLVLSGSVRYDNFSDFGHTTNPKLGVTYKPVNWLSLHGNYSTSFNAPSPIDQLNSQSNFVQAFPFVAFVRPGDKVGFFDAGTVALRGAKPNLKPQTAKTWSVGFDMDPPLVPGLHMGANYYSVRFKDLLDIPTPGTGIFTNFPNNVQTSLTGFTRAQVEAFASQALGGVAAVQNILASGQPIYLLVDFRSGNYGKLNVDGIDFNVSYRKATGFGGVDAGVQGNYTVKRTSQVADGAPVIDLLHADAVRGTNGSPRLQLEAEVGADIGRFRAQATLNHTAGYGVVRSATLPQDRVGAFNTVNLFFKYDFPAEGMTKDLSATLNVNNVFNTAPPVWKNLNDNGYANGFTLGRLVMLGLSKKF